ncbi:hypothetical protein Hanom_Chr05g00394901 [Helianthus anomalus]
MLAVRSLKPLLRQHSLFHFIKLCFIPKQSFYYRLEFKIHQNGFHSSSQILLQPFTNFSSDHGSDNQKPHNYLHIFEKTDKNTIYHSIIDVLTSLKYKAILTANAPIYQDTRCDFWANAEIQEQKKVPYAITSKVGGTLVAITPNYHINNIWVE